MIQGKISNILCTVVSVVTSTSNFCFKRTVRIYSINHYVDSDGRYGDVDGHYGDCDSPNEHSGGHYLENDGHWMVIVTMGFRKAPLNMYYY